MKEVCSVEKNIVEVLGYGKSKQNAIADALSKITNITKNEEKIIFQITPQDIQVISAKKKMYTEHFLFFFLPRQRIEYEINLKVSLETKFILTNEIYFKNTIINEPNNLKGLLPKWILGGKTRGDTE